MSAASIAVVVCFGIYAFAMLTAVTWMHLPPRAKTGGELPPVTVLKPLKGVDESLEENLESFAGTGYPGLQVVFGVADPDDPALPLAEQVRARHPETDIEIVVGDAHIGRNPKVNLLAAMLPSARHELCLISDSNVRATRGYLEATVAPLADPHVGLVSNPVVGDGETTWQAAIENIHLCTFAAAMQIAAKVVTRLDAVVGKSMLFRRDALEGIGGLAAFRNILAEDQLIGRRMPASGYGVRMIRAPVVNWNRTWSIRRFYERYTRWAIIRTRSVPWSYPLELVANPVALSLVAVVTGLSSPWLLPAVALAKIGLDAFAVWGLRGHGAKPWHLALVPLKDLFLVFIWFVPFFGAKVVWRGQPLRLLPGTRLVSPEAFARARRMRRGRRHEGGVEMGRLPLHVAPRRTGTH